MTDATLTPDKMSDELSHLSTVIDVKPSSGGFLADAFHFPPQLTQGRPVLIISVDSMAMIRNRLDSIIGQRSTVDVLFHQMGIANGNGIWKGIESTLGGKPSRENLEEVAPLPGPSDSAQILPPCASTKPFVMLTLRYHNVQNIVHVD